MEKGRWREEERKKNGMGNRVNRKGVGRREREREE